MYVTNGNILSLMKWFKENHYQYLCLLVAGHIRDYDFFKSVFDNRATIDIVTGRNIAIFLFTNSQDKSVLLTIRNYRNYNEGHYLPGEQVAKYEKIYAYRVNEIEDKLREKVIRQSQFISNEICDYFDISIKEIPCILIVDREQIKNPYIIPTKGEITINDFYNFLKELRQLVESVPDIKSLNKKLRIYRERKRIEDNLSQMTEIHQIRQNGVDNLYNQLKVKIENVRNMIIEMGVSEIKSKQIINEETAKNLRGYLTGGLSHDDIGKAELRAFQDAFKVPEFKSAVSDIVKFWKKIEYDENSARKSLLKLQDIQYERDRLQEIDFKSFKEEVEIASKKLKSIDPKMDKLERKYRNRFWRESKFRPIKDFIQKFIGFNKNVKEVLSIEEALKRITE